MDFFKMHGLGNDFIVLNCFRAKIAEPRRLAKKICDRRLGIGGDGVIFAMPSQKANCRMRIFNCDGSEAEMSGNGIRCLGKFLRDKGIAKGKVITVETNAGIRTLQVVSGSGRITNIRVDMGKPDLPEKDSAPWTFQDEGINVLDRMFKPTALSMGNPHCVIFVDDTEAFLVEKYGPAIENHTGFPQRTNVEFVEIISRREIRQRTWERGVGETLACGTGACAGAVASAINGLTQRKVRVRLRGGILQVEWREDGSVLLTGPAETVFTGDWPNS
jgi:diaminopimelate epimerase